MTQQESERATKPMGTMAKSVALVLFGAGVATVGPQMAAALSTLVPLPAFAFPGEAPAESSLQAQADAPAVPRNQIAIAPSVSSPNLIADIVREVGPSVVRIDASRTVRSIYRLSFRILFSGSFLVMPSRCRPPSKSSRGGFGLHHHGGWSNYYQCPRGCRGRPSTSYPQGWPHLYRGSDRSRFGDGHCGDQN